MNVTKTPYSKNQLTLNAKQDIIEEHVKGILTTLGMDLTDDSLRDTPKRVAKMYVHELFGGLDEDAFPKMTVQENKFQYDQMLVECNITLNSVCEHHLVPIVGVCHIAYIPGSKVLGLSKFNRMVRYYARRPQVQERLTQQIQQHLQHVLETENVAVVIDAAHFCVRMRGVQDSSTLTRTSALGGVFRTQATVRDELFKALPKVSDIRLT